MLNRVFPIPTIDSRARNHSTPPGLALRIRARLKRRRLDAELAAGADPAGSDALSLRADQLRSRRVRLELATALMKKLDQASAREGLSLKLQPHRSEIRAASDDLLALVLRLRDGRPIEVEGAARTALLLTAGASPFDPDSGERIRPALRSAGLALDEARSASDELPAAA